jgi:lipid-binding SYLF domain-containing protein
MNTHSKTLTACMAASMSTIALGAHDDLDSARKQVTDSTQVVRRMQGDPAVARMLENARGVFIVPDYGKGALVVGGSGGEGVVLARQGDEWSNPAFFNVGSVSIGPQAGAVGGSIAMILNNDKALNMFKNQASNFSFDANAGIAVINYSADGQASTGRGDVVLWSDTEGAFAGASLGVTDISRDEDENNAYYGGRTSPQQILGGTANNPHSMPLRNALAGDAH